MRLLLLLALAIPHASNADDTTFEEAAYQTWRDEMDKNPSVRLPSCDSSSPGDCIAEDGTTTRMTVECDTDLDCTTKNPSVKGDM